MALETVARVYDLTEAQLLRSQLESAGIPCFIPEEYHVSAAWHLSLAVSIRVMVPGDCKEEAEAILLSQRQTAGHNESLQSCPNCGASDLHRRKSWLAGLIATAIALPVLLRTGKLYCRECGHEWRSGAAGAGGGAGAD